MERTLLKIDPGIRWHICDIESHVVWNHCFSTKEQDKERGDVRKERSKRGALAFKSK